MRRLSVSAFVVVLVLTLAAPAALAQDWRGRGRAQGVVLDLAGGPLTGAEVTLRHQELGEGPPAARTGADGAFSFVFLAPGIWEIRVDADGFRPAEGRIVVLAEGVADPTEIRLESLDVVTPSFAEGDPAGSVRGWLANGDVLLAKGRPAEARGEYEKALATPGVLAAADRAEVLATVARTHFLEGDAAAAERALRPAVVLDPGSERNRQLLAALFAGADREGEAEAFFGQLATDPAVAAEGLRDLLAAPEPARTAPRLPERPTLPPEPGRTGRYRTALIGEGGPVAPSPLATVDVFVERWGADREALAASDPDGGAYDLAEETFEVYVPDAYVPGAGYGMLVWVSPTPYGGLDRPELQAVLDRHRLLWVGANGSGNGRFTWDRVSLALAAAAAMAELYDLDPGRVYAAGYSGGGRVASGLAMLYPDVFRGALSLFGAHYFRPVPVPDRPGAHYPPAFREPPRARLAEILAEGRFVLLTGERDFNRMQTGAYHRAMVAAGFAHATLIEIPEATHYHQLSGGELERAVVALDGDDRGARRPASRRPAGGGEQEP